MSARNRKNCWTCENFPSNFILHLIQIQAIIGMSQLLGEVEFGFDYKAILND